MGSLVTVGKLLQGRNLFSINSIRGRLFEELVGFPTNAMVNSGVISWFLCYVALFTFAREDNSESNVESHQPNACMLAQYRLKSERCLMTSEVAILSKQLPMCKVAAFGQFVFDDF